MFFGRLFTWAFISLLVGFSALYFLGFVLNVTNSLPYGIYQTIKKDKLERGDIVLVCPKDNVYALAIEREYLDYGFCANGARPMQKIVVGLPGDIVVKTKEGLSVNARTLKNSACKPFDSKNRALPCYAGGVILPNQALVINEFSKDSFDGRYFGTIPNEWIIAHTRVVLTW